MKSRNLHSLILCNTLKYMVVSVLYFFESQELLPIKGYIFTILLQLS